MPSSDGDTLEPIKRRDKERLFITVTNPPDDEHPSEWVRNITSDNLHFEARTKETGDTIVIEKDTSTGTIFKSDPTNGKAVIDILPSDTERFTKKTTLECQLTISDMNGSPTTINFKVPVSYRR